MGLDYDEATEQARLRIARHEADPVVKRGRMQWFADNPATIDALIAATPSPAGGLTMRWFSRKPATTPDAAEKDALLACTHGDDEGDGVRVILLDRDGYRWSMDASFARHLAGRLLAEASIVDGENTPSPPIAPTIPE